ncbi:MAG TPA: PAS domain S-box protein [Anaerolineales bacterium]|nr:PAS domain S-box protein [Anaerolineales bacterium]
MKLDPLRRLFRPLFGPERLETTSRFLYIILASTLIMNFGMIVLRSLSGGTFGSITLRVLTGMFLFQCLMLFVVKRGYVNQAALALVLVAWVSVTYQAWASDGVRDAALYVYILIIFVASLLTNWRISVVLSILSIAAVWFFAIVETKGLRVPHTDSPLNIASDLTAVFIILFLLVYLVINTIRRSLYAVRASEEKFRKVFDVSPVAIAVASVKDGRLIDANKAYWRLSGSDPNYAIGKTTVELGIWSNYEERAKFVESLKEQKSLHNPAYMFRSESGEDHIALAFYELIDLDNEPAVMSMYYDITEQRNVQLALQASEQKYRNFIEQSMEGIWFLAFDQPIPISLPEEEQALLIYKYGYVAECNDVLAHMYGYSSNAEILGARLLDLQAGEELSESNYEATLKLVKEGYRSGNRETREQTRDGKIVYFLNNAVGIIKDDCLIGLWGSQLDITALKNTEDALRRSEARTRALLDAIPDMIFEFKGDGTMLQFVASTTNRPLLPPEEFLGKKIQDVLPSVADQTIFAIERVLESGHVHAFEYQLMQDGVNKTFEARIVPLSTDTVLAMVRDISLQKWIIGEREKLITELELKNAELERFTYTVSHDLKSPLITIKGFLGFLREDSKSGNYKRLDSDIQRISDAADKMQRLLNDLLELSRIGRLVNVPQSVNLNEVIAEVLELLHGRIHGGTVPIRVTVEENLPKVHGDRPRLFEVLQNLIDNAAKFMGDQPNPCITIGQEGTTEDNAVVFFVRDNGIGIDPKFKDRIFGLFDKLDPRSDGTGIGLALAKRIIEFHRGKIWVESEPGKGASFYFTLPQSENLNAA